MNCCEKFYTGKIDKRKTAFTLAEVLITLGIIGVVAAVTLPTLIQAHKKHVLETRIKKFVSISEQVIKMAEIEHGPKEYFEELPVSENLKDGNGYLEHYNKYYGKYITTISHKVFSDGVAFGLADGSGFVYYYDIKFCVDYKKCLKLMDEAEKSGTSIIARTLFADGKNIFMFSQFPKIRYIWQWDGTEEDLVNNARFGCNENNNSEDGRRYCTELLRRNGWNMPKDYPIKL